MASFLQLAAEEKTPLLVHLENFVPSYFVTTLAVYSDAPQPWTL